MEGNLSEEKVTSGSSALAANCDAPCSELNESTLRDTIDTSEGGMQNNACTEKSEVSKEIVNNDNENKINSKVMNDNENTKEMDNDEQWDLKKIMSIAAVIRKSPIKCSHETCTLVAATVWVSNLKQSEKWYSCLDCQENDFDGWPDPDELPLKYMTQEHKDTLMAKCSKYKDCNFPVFEEKSPSKDSTTAFPSVVTTNAITPLSNAAVCIEKRFENSDPVHSTVTPNHSGMKLEARNLASKKASVGENKPNKAHLEIHRKWQAAAEELGGPGARVVLQKPIAKKMIFDFLFDAFCPMNITEIHKGLLAQIPSPILKPCLDDMAFDNESFNQFIETDHESGDDESRLSKASKKSASMGTETHFKNALSFKSGKGSNSGLYYVNYNDAKGGGGLDPDEKDKLFTESANADAKLAKVKSKLSTARATIEKLLSEPMNSELNTLLWNAEAESSSLLEKVEEVRKLTVNVQHIQHTKKKIEYYASFWRKRRKLCMDFLITMEELTDGTVSVNKCKAGDGPIEIDSDEASAKLAVEFAKKKMIKGGSGKLINAITASKSGCQPASKFAAVLLDSHGKVQRIFADSFQK